VAGKLLASCQSRPRGLRRPSTLGTSRSRQDSNVDGGELGCKCGCNGTGLFAVVRVRGCSLRCLQAPLSGTFVPRRAGANVRVVGWQCGGQGFESPQLHPDLLA
jgi:hypothetical protein